MYAQVYNETTLNIAFDKREFLLKYLKPKSHILDLGCGSGRDSKAFLTRLSSYGYRWFKSVM